MRDRERRREKEREWRTSFVITLDCTREIFLFLDKATAVEAAAPAS